MVAIQVPCPGTCTPWCEPEDVIVPPGVTFEPVLLADCVQAASDLLYDLSGRQWAGICQDTVRPCARSLPVDHGRPFAGLRGGGYYPGPWLGGNYSLYGWCECNSRGEWGCGSVPAVGLGVFPLTGVVEVLIDGEAVDPAQFRIRDDRYLVRLADADGNPQGFPCCQRADLPATEPETWQVTVTYGSPPPTLGRLAAAELAGQLCLALKPSQGGVCLLPERITQMTRQGETIVFLDPQSFLADGFTGLPVADRFIRSVNPYGIPRRASVLSPDIGKRVWREHV